MNTKARRTQAEDTIPPQSGLTLAAVYPGLYCPRCGSDEIGLKLFYHGDAIWGCRDCRADFKLNFPNKTRF